MNFGARWTINDVKEGKRVTYENLETGVIFDCGIERSDTPFNMLLEYILSEGDAGDLVFVNGMFYTQTQKEACA